MKDSKNGIEVGNYIPIACLKLIWKLLTGIINDKTYDHLKENRPRGERSICDRQIHIAKLQEQENKFNHGLGGLQEGLRYGSPLMDRSHDGMVNLSDNIIGLIKQSMNKWKTNLYADEKLLGSVPIRRGIFQGDSFSPLLFLIALLPLTYILRETGMWYQLEKNVAKVNYLLFMNDLELYGRMTKKQTR